MLMKYILKLLLLLFLMFTYAQTFIFYFERIKDITSVAPILTLMSAVFHLYFFIIFFCVAII